MNMVALIPARKGSKRCPGKNTRLLGGHTLVWHAVESAMATRVFSRILVCSDDPGLRSLCHGSINGVWFFQRDRVLDDQPDIEWVKAALARCESEAFAILRPTSPFRSAATIRRAYEQFQRSEVHSLRAVEPAAQHPGKTWWCNGPGYPMTPVCDATRSDGTPWHSSPTQTLPPAYVQNASLEMAWTYVVTQFGTIAGRKVAPFVTQGYEGFDVNTEEDFAHAEELVRTGKVTLPSLKRAVLDESPSLES